MNLRGIMEPIYYQVQPQRRMGRLEYCCCEILWPNVKCCFTRCCWPFTKWFCKGLGKLAWKGLKSFGRGVKSCYVGCNDECQARRERREERQEEKRQDDIAFQGAVREEAERNRIEQEVMDLEITQALNGGYPSLDGKLKSLYLISKETEGFEGGFKDFREDYLEKKEREYRDAQIDDFINHEDGVGVMID